MGIRDRVKGAVRRVLGREVTPPPAAPPSNLSAAAPSAVAVAPSVHERPAPPKPVAGPVAGPVAPPEVRAAPPASVAAPVEGAEDEAVKAEKIEKARTRARKGVLKHIGANGGTMAMADAHDFSERRYFIAHRGYSDMMEWWLKEGYIRYEEGIITVTEEGAAYAAS